MDIGQILTVIGVIFFSMTIHEVMHGLIALKLGDRTALHEGRLTLNPLKHIDPFMTIILPVMLAIVGAPIFGGAKPVPFNPYALRGGEWGAALVAVAGPLVNFVLAFVTFGIYVLVEATAPSYAQSLLVTAVMVNLGFFVFNMLPIPPLDGSRVVYALAPDGVRKGMEVIERYGVILVFAVVLLASPIITSVMMTATRAIITVFSNIFGVSI